MVSTEPARSDAKLEMIRLALPEGSSRQAQILGRGPEAAPAVVDILREIGVV